MSDWDAWVGKTPSLSSATLFPRELRPCLPSADHYGGGASPTEPMLPAWVMLPEHGLTDAQALAIIIRVTGGTSVSCLTC